MLICVEKERKRERKKNAFQEASAQELYEAAKEEGPYDD